MGDELKTSQKGLNCNLCQVGSLPGASISSSSHEVCLYFHSWPVSSTLQANLVIVIMQLIPITQNPFSFFPHFLFFFLMEFVFLPHWCVCTVVVVLRPLVASIYTNPVDAVWAKLVEQHFICFLAVVWT